MPFIPYQQWPEYLPETEEPLWVNPRQVGTEPKGKRWGWRFFSFEEYVSDTEPDLHASDTLGGFRIIFWHRPTRDTKPRGWLQLSKNPSWREGVVTLDECPHHERWSKSARQALREWQSECSSSYRIEEAGLDEYERAYRQSIVYERVGGLRADALRTYAQSGSPHALLLGVRSLKSGQLVAGLSAIHSPTHAATYYQSGFYLPSETGRPHMIALMDHWHGLEKARGTRTLFLGGFWHPGKSKKGWGGFSLFKSKLAPAYVDYQPELVRLRLSRRMKA